MIFPEGKPEGWDELSPIVQWYLMRLTWEAQPVDEYDEGEPWLYPDPAQYTELFLSPEQTKQRINAALAASLKSRTMYPGSHHPPLVQRGWQTLNEFVAKSRQELVENGVMIFVASLSFGNDPDFPFPEIALFTLQEVDQDFLFKLLDWQGDLDRSFLDLRGVDKLLYSPFPVRTTLKRLYDLSQQSTSENLQPGTRASEFFYASTGAATVLYGYPFFIPGKQDVFKLKEEVLGLCFSNPIMAAETCLQLESWVKDADESPDIKKGV